MSMITAKGTADVKAVETERKWNFASRILYSVKLYFIIM